MKASDFLLVYCPVPSLKTAELIAKQLLSLKLVACVNVLAQGTSFYEWKGQMEKSKEFIMILKTKKTLANQVFKEITKHHPYECPSICGLSLDKAPSSFLQWMNQSLSS